MPRNKMPSPAGPPQRQRWFDYILPYIFNGRSHAELMKIIPVCSDWARVSLSLLWSQRVCINTWLHAKGLSQTGFWRFSPPDLFFLLWWLQTVSSERNCRNTPRTQRSVSSALFHACVFSTDISSLSKCLCRLAQRCHRTAISRKGFPELTSLPCTAALPAAWICCGVQDWAPITPRPLVLCHMFVLVTVAVSNPAGEAVDFHISVWEHVKFRDWTNTSDRVPSKLHVFIKISVQACSHCATTCIIHLGSCLTLHGRHVFALRMFWPTDEECLFTWMFWRRLVEVPIACNRGLIEAKTVYGCELITGPHVYTWVLSRYIRKQNIMSNKKDKTKPLLSLLIAKQRV